MGPAIAAAIFSAFAVAAAFFIRPRFVQNAAISRAALFWLIATPILLAIPSMLAALVICGLALALLTPVNRDDRAAYYIITLAAVPAAMAAAVPFPGINYLISLRFAKIACVVLLAPVLLFAARPNTARYAPAAGVFIIILTTLVALQEFRATSITNGMRIAVDQILLLALPYMALTRLLSGVDRFDKVFSSFLFVGLIFFFCAVIAQLTNWNFHTYLTERHGIPAFADFRHGVLRTRVTLNPMMVGFIATLGLLAAEYYRSRRKLGLVAAMFYRVVFLATVFFTYSRGAWLATAVALATYYLFASVPRGVRPALIGFAAFVLTPAAAMFVLRGDLNTIDEFGSFEYRRQLLEAAWIQIRERPFFGDPYFLESGNFDHLYQGQGIIDVVNYYVQIALEHGLVGLSLYLAAFASVIFGLLGIGRHTGRAGNRDLELQRAFMLGAIFSFLALMVTVSGVALAPHYGVIVLSVAASFLSAVRRDMREARHTGTSAENKAEAQAELTGDLFGETRHESSPS